jgi:hypothetical protein
MCGTIIRALAGNIRMEILLNFCKIMAIPRLLYEYECWTLTEWQKSRLEAMEVSFLRAMLGYQLIDHRFNENIRVATNFDINCRMILK